MLDEVTTRELVALVLGELVLLAASDSLTVIFVLLPLPHRLRFLLQGDGPGFPANVLKGASGSVTIVLPEGATECVMQRFQFRSWATSFQ